MSDFIEATTSSLEALSDQYRAIAHNLANVSTAGYKRRCTSFVQLLQAQISGAEEGAAATSGTVVEEMSIDFTQGSLMETGRALDLALTGKGFFVLETPDGPLYTRHGAFVTNDTGQLVDSAGRIVAGEAGPIVIPPAANPQNVQVSKDGTLSASGAGFGKVRLVEFEDESSLLPVGDSCYLPAEGVEPTAATGAAVQQGYQEASNVRAVEELIALITVTRLYEANLKAIQTQDERLRNILHVAMS
jgi:flagellar basal-body rod protein FlgF